VASSDAVEGLARRAHVILENHRLLAELARSRERIAAAAAQERLRLERALHDGAQQRLLLLKLTLSDLRGKSGDELAAGLAVAEEHLDAALDDIRALSHGIYPPILLEGGLDAALRSLAIRTEGAQVSFATSGVPRARPDVEYAVYLSIVEAVQNATKHAGPGVAIGVAVESRNGDLRFSVTDDGHGFDRAAVGNGAGLVSMHDRVASIGGDLAIETRPGSGTTVEGVVPGAFPTAPPA
jgi:signal transduction histidine kinase